MRQVLIGTTLAMAWMAAFAQTTKAPETGSVPTDPKSAAAAQAKVDARKAASPSADETMTKKMPESESNVTAATANVEAVMKTGNSRQIRA